MRTFFIFLFIFCFKNYSFAINLEKNPIYNSILLLSGDIDKNKALKYSNIIDKYSKKYKIDPFLIVSISRQESRINLNTTREVIDDNIQYDEDNKKFYKTVEITDFCMMQIHKSNVIGKNLDPSRLLEDADYCIHEGFKILNYFKSLKKNDKYWWTRYNASKDDMREIYKHHVLSHYKVIKENIPNYKDIIANYEEESELSYSSENN
jgi:hypothetical protein